MANLKPKANVNKSEAEEIIEEALSEEISFADEEVVYEMLAGYKDPETGTIHREFTLREMTGRDEEAINKADVKVNGSKVISTLLTRCVTRIGSITPSSVGGSAEWSKVIRSIYVGDQDLMLMKLRKLSIGEEIEVSHVCPSCGAKLNTVLDIDELEVIDFKGVREIDFCLPKGYKDKKGVVHKEGKMRIPTGLDREILTPLAKSNRAKAETTMLTRLCQFNDGAYVDDDVMSGLAIRDREYLSKLLLENNFGIRLEVNITCDQCGDNFDGALNAVNFT